MRFSGSKYAGISMWALFLIWPLLALVSSIRNLRSGWAKNGLWLFIIFYGFTFYIQEGNDASRYIQYFQELHSSEMTFKSFAGMFYTEGQRSVDVYGPMVAFLVSRFTDDPRILFATIAMVFGFFYSRNIWFLISKTEKNNDPYLLGIIILIAFIIPIWSINGVRFWTASQVFFYGATHFFLDRKRKGLLICTLTILFHYSFLIAVLLLYLYLIIRNRTTLFFIFFLIGVFISEINIPVISQTMVAYTPAVFHDRITGYTDVDRIESKMSEFANVNWYVRWHTKSLHLIVDLLLIVIFLKGKEIWGKRKELLNFFSFLLMFRAAAGFLMQIPTLERFLLLNDFLAMGFIFLYFYYNKMEIVSRRVVLYLMPVIFFYLVVTVRTGLDNTALLSFISNPVTAPLLPNDQPLIDFLK